MKTPHQYPKGKLAWVWENLKGRRLLFVISMILAVVSNLLQLTVPYFSGEIIDLFQNVSDAGETMAAHTAELYPLIGWMIALVFLRALVTYAETMGCERASQYTLYHIRRFLYDKIQRQDMKFYSAFRTGDLMTRLTGDLDAVRHNVAWVSRMIVGSSVLYLATAVYFFLMNWKLALCTLALSPLIFFIIVKFRIRVAPRHAALREKLANMNTNAQENISGNRVVKAFAREEYEIDKFDRTNTDYRDTAIGTSMTWLKFYPYVETVANSLQVVLLVVGGIFIIIGEISVGQFVSYNSLIWAICNPMRELGNIMNEFQRFSAAADKVMEIYYSEAEITDAPDAIAHPEHFRGEIEFRDVTFSYDDAQSAVLKELSFKVRPGETVAVIGETGCGKTSLIQMIPRFFDPQLGEVLIDGVNVKKYKLEDLRRNIGLATQDVLLYSDTITGNIAYGVSQLTADDIVKYARCAAAQEFIEKMPEGYDTIVGERGVGLSGGQKQRISLARALAVEPSILILDDTTSAVDMETEKEIQHALRELDFSCTKIIIAQRISTTKFADRIIVLKDGRIAEEGSHSELIAKGGHYAQLVALQLGETLEACRDLVQKTAKEVQA